MTIDHTDIDGVDLLVDSSNGPATTCVVCGSDIAAGHGLTATYQGRTLRFKCPGCLSRFSADPERYLTGGPGVCCGGQKKESPPSEWMTD